MQIAGQDQAIAARLARLLVWGTRPWEKTIERPLVVEERDAARNVQRTFFFAVEASDLRDHAPRLCLSAREQAFASTVAKILESKGRASWPVFVFSGVSGDTQSPHAFSLATTRRIIVQDGRRAPEPAAAILLNKTYWGADDAVLGSDDRLTEVTARHEVYHTKRAWLRAEQTAIYTDAIEARLRRAGSLNHDRTALECLARQGILAWEEVAAVDWSLEGVALPPQHRQPFLEYRERNRELHKKIVRQIAGLFTATKERGARKELEHWLSELLRKDIHPRLQ